MNGNIKVKYNNYYSQEFKWEFCHNNKSYKILLKDIFADKDHLNLSLNDINWGKLHHPTKKNSVVYSFMMIYHLELIQ